jgi:hypothetical protein
MDGITLRSGDRISGKVNDAHLKEVSYRIQGGNSSGNAITLTQVNGTIDRDLTHCIRVENSTAKFGVSVNGTGGISESIALFHGNWSTGRRAEFISTNVDRFW